MASMYLNVQNIQYIRWLRASLSLPIALEATLHSTVAELDKAHFDKPQWPVYTSMARIFSWLRPSKPLYNFHFDTLNGQWVCLGVQNIPVAEALEATLQLLVAEPVEAHFDKPLDLHC